MHVFKASVTIDQNTDVDSVIRGLSQRSESGGLAPDSREFILGQSQKVIEDFFDRGTALIKLGSQMSASQNIDGPGYSISIKARFGIDKASWVDRLTRLFKR